MTALSADDFSQSGAEESYSEGVIDHLRAVEGTAVAALVRDGKEEAVLAIRRTYQDSMRTELIEIVERLTDRTVSAFMSSNHVNPDVAIESFVLELLDTPKDNQTDTAEAAHAA